MRFKSFSTTQHEANVQSVFTIMVIRFISGKVVHALPHLETSMVFEKLIEGLNKIITSKT